MVVPNRISHQLSQQDLDDIMGYVQSINAALPFLVGLTAKERVRMNKAGDASQAFIRKSADVAQQVDAFLPRGFDIAELHRDIELLDALQPVAFAVSQLAEKLRDTHALVASEAYTASLEVYRAAKQAQGPAGLEGVVSELSRRFARTTAPAADTPEPEAGDDDGPPSPAADAPAAG